MCQNLQLSVAIIVLLLGVATGSTAGNEASIDRITVKADRLVFDQQTGVQTLSGNVVITQGDISISGDSIQVATHNGAITRIFGTGQPIRFRQKLANGDTVQTESNEIDYPTPTWTLTFRGNVIVQRGVWRLDTEVVEYNIRNRNFSASGGIQSNATSTESRVNIIYRR